jgi:hypothetical protein
MLVAVSGGDLEFWDLEKKKRIDTFERVTIVEKREVLKTLSLAMKQLLLAKLAANLRPKS